MSENLLRDLATHGISIGMDAERGDENAKDVMKYYLMWHRCPGDPGAQVLTKLALDKWIASKDPQ
jgi:hypothetical protein